jgi:hypothetical protein
MMVYIAIKGDLPREQIMQLLATLHETAIPNPVCAAPPGFLNMSHTFVDEIQVKMVNGRVNANLQLVTLT